MIQRIGNLLLIVALLATTGGHWAVLQSVAWTAMLAEHWQADPLATAVEKTFDGQHPCKLCQAIQAAKKSDKKTEFPTGAQKIEFLPMPGHLKLYAPAAFQRLPVTDTFADAPLPTPPTPPPRCLPV